MSDFSITAFSAYLIILLYLLAADAAGFLVYLLLSLFCATIASTFLEPGFDHGFYISRSLGYASASAAFWDDLATASPLAGVIWFVREILVDERLAVLFINSVNLAGISVFSEKICSFSSAHGSRVRRRLALMASYALYPSIVILMVSANKDLILGLFLLGGTYFFLRLIDRRPIPAMHRLAFLLMFGIAFRGLYVGRFYLAGILVGALSMCIFMIFLEGTRLRRFYKEWLFYTSLILLSAMVLHYEWNYVRTLVHTFSGRAVIAPIYNATMPGLFNSILYGASGVMVATLGIFSASLWSETLSEGNQCIGMYESLIFTVSFALLFIKQGKGRFERLTMAFIFLHLGLQVWASPNFGSLFRHRVLDYLMLAPLIINARREQFFDFVGSESHAKPEQIRPAETYA